MTQAFRTASGGSIDRTRPLRFRFDGKSLVGHAGDTLASALLANGVRLIGRSFKYHRPRGILSAGPEEPNALIELRSGERREPNSKATTIELFDGLEATSQNRWPSLGFDLGAANSLFGPVLAAGFYYKTFMWPASFWEKVYEPLIRKAAGLGRAAAAPDPDIYEKAYAHCDLLVAGGGPAGLMAALVAGRAGARVIVAEQDFAFGGRLAADRRTIGDGAAGTWVAETLAELMSLPDVRLIARTTVFGAYDDGTFGALERVADHLARPETSQPRQRLWRVVAKRSLVAAGAIERPLVFGDNDRPGVMLAGAVRSYVNRFASKVGEKAVLFVNNDDALTTANDLRTVGVDIVAIVDPRPDSSDAVREIARDSGAELVLGGVVRRALGSQAVEAVEVAQSAGEVRRIEADLVAMSGGWSPAVHLTSHKGHKPVWDEQAAAFVPGELPAGMSVAGAAGGALTLASALAEGARTGAVLASDLGFRASTPNLPETDPESTRQAPLWRVKGVRGKSFVDFQNDVTVTDVELARREGFRAVEHLKRYTTLGMATDQGKTSNVTGLALMAELNGKSIAETGTTVFRPPVTPITIGALAGHHRGKAFRPTRTTAAHGFALELGAQMVEAGAWLRASYFPKPGDSGWQAAAVREAQTVRTAVGWCDVSTLGKIDVQGADAAAFLDRVYANTISTLKVGRARYGLMLREDGFVLDDGTVGRLGETHFVLSTTTANAGRVMQHLDFCHQVVWPDLDVRMASISEQWAQFAVAGPKSRATLQNLVDSGFDIANEALPFMGVLALTVGGGVPARLFRISFSGELAYELAVPAGFGDTAARAIMAAGAPFGIVPYGLEAMSAMRIEKGHAAGGEINGQTTAQDLGMGKLVSAKKDCIGKAMAQRPALVDPARPRLVGFVPVDRQARLRGGMHVVAKDNPADGKHDEGHLTSVAHSPTLGHWIGLGLLARGEERIGETVRAVSPLHGEEVEAIVSRPCFVDPEGVRLRG